MDVGMWVMNSRLMETVVLREIILAAIKRTFFEHFCAGSNMEEVGLTVSKLWDVGLKGMLDYGFEHAGDNETCDSNLEEFLRTVESAKALPSSSVSFIYKPTILFGLHNFEARFQDTVMRHLCMRLFT